ncbi:MAG: tRNA (adenosine(37)-N6)-dimethylallyltransferase MiaA [Candidatus Hydrogenedentota bacterium]
MKKVIILSGPTASGKTETAINLSKKINTEIISADSRQIYRYMDIGTAKPTKEQQNLVKHHLIDIKNPDERFSVYEFYKLALDVVEDIIKRAKVPLIVGGTGLYIKILQEGIFEERGEIDNGYRKRLNSMTIDELKKLLKEKDPLTFKRIDTNNQRRIIRAIEIKEKTGFSIVELWDKRQKPSYDFVHLYLNPDPQTLDKRIKQRTENIYKLGLIDETKRLLDIGYNKNLESMSGIGYKETISYLEGEIGLDEAMHRTYIRTRQYARRQKIWFKKEKKIVISNEEEIWGIIEDRRQGLRRKDEI